MAWKRRASRSCRTGRSCGASAQNLIRQPASGLSVRRCSSEIGWPVVLKAVIAGIVHKTEAGLVRVGIRSEDEMRVEVRAMLERAQAVGGQVLGLLIQEMARPIAELLVGGRVDPDFGPVIVVGGGGILVELYKDVAIRLAPVSEDMAREMIGETLEAKRRAAS